MDRKIIAEKFFEALYNVNNPEQAQAIAEDLLAPDFVDYSPQFGATADKEGFKQTVCFINSVFEQKYKIDKLIVEEDLFVGVWLSDVKHIGEFMGVSATHKEFQVNGITIYQIVDNKIQAHWEQFEVTKILQNLGILQG
jgi:predicted ester cyclase